MRLRTTKEGKRLLDLLHLWTQDRTQYPMLPESWYGLLGTRIFLDLCSEQGPALEVEVASFAALYTAVRSYQGYTEDWSLAELYLACKSLAVVGCFVDVYPPAVSSNTVREILGEFYSALANSERLAIVLLLQSAGGLLAVSEIAECLSRADRVQSVRRHLRILHDARLIERHWEDGAGRYQYDRRAVMANLELTQEVLL